MANIIDIEPWWRFGAALLIGALIGIEREFVQQHATERGFAGIRTFSFIALFGAVAAYASESTTPAVFLIAYGGYALLLSGSRIANTLRGESGGITTEVVALLTPLLGALVIWGRVEIAAALAVVTALILTLKFPLHDIARRMTVADLRATLEFGLLAIVILPLLPNRALDPYGVLNPFVIWLLVVFVSGMNFLGYILMKLLGPERGTGLAGLFGGLVSSTAATVSFASQSREDPTLSPATTVAILLASGIMLPRQIVEVLVVNPSLIGELWVPTLIMLVVGIALTAFLWRQRPREIKHTMDLANPLRISTALSFALIFTVVLLVVKLASSGFGNTGLLVASGVSGLAGVDSITLSASSLAASGQIGAQAAAGAIWLATLVNTAEKAVLAMVLGSLPVRRTIGWTFAAMLLVGLIAGFLTVWATV
jgi:uncharacterized membrane protein (DUF4010 family)